MYLIQFLVNKAVYLSVLKLVLNWSTTAIHQ